MNDLEVELSDFDAAIRCLEKHADDADVVRRSIRAALDHLYSLEANQPDGYWGRVERSDDGQVCAGLTFIRGRAVHRLLRGHEYEILVPSETLAPSEYLAAGGNWRWLDWDDLDDELRVEEKGGRKEQDRQRTRRKYVRDQIQGRLVRQTFAEARALLVPGPARVLLIVATTRSSVMPGVASCGQGSATPRTRTGSSGGRRSAGVRRRR